LSAGTLVIAEPTPSDPTPGKPTPGIDTTALDAVIHEAGIARDRVETASNASQVPTGTFWVSESEWNAFDSVYKTAVETKINPSSQSAVDTAKTNLEAALVTFYAAKKDGTGAAITLSGTITVKNNGQIVPYVSIQAHDDNWTWDYNKKFHLMGENTPWSMIIKPFSSPTDIFFEIYGYDNDKYENLIFNITVEGLSKEVYDTDVNNININQDLNFITLRGTFNYKGQAIPSVTITMYREDDGFRLGTVNISNAGIDTPWSMMIPPQAVNTAVVFYIVGFNGPLVWEYDKLFDYWGKGPGVKVGNQNQSGIALHFITLSGTVSVTYNGSPPPVVEIAFQTDSDWLGSTRLPIPSANTPWSFVIPAFTSDTVVHFSVIIEDEDENDLAEPRWWIEERTVRNTNVSGIGIALNLITLSGTINVTYNGSQVPIVEITIAEKFWNNDGKYDEWRWVTYTGLHSPSANTPWSIIISAFTSDTEIGFDVSGKDEYNTELFWRRETRTVKDKSVTGIELNLGNITD
jgi:hypothetical protein